MLRYGLLMLALLQMAVCSFAQETLAIEEIVLLNPKDSLPPDARAVGKPIKIIDAGFKVNCTYENIVEEGKNKTRKNGGNVLKVSEWRTPGAMSTCYGIKGQAYVVGDLPALRSKISLESDSVVKSLVPEGSEYAMLYIYRPAGGTGVLVSYNIHLGDSIICRVHNDRYYAIPIYQEGKSTIWTRTESRAEVPIDVQFGKAYFIKCGVTMGAFVGHPTLRIVDPRNGVKQFKFDKVRTIANE